MTGAGTANNLSLPPPNMPTAGPPPRPPHNSTGSAAGLGFGFQPRYPMRPRFGLSGAGRTPMGGQGSSSTGGDQDVDAKRPRKSMMRKTVDYNSSFMVMLDRRIWQQNQDHHALQPDVLFYPELQPPSAYLDNPANAVTTRFVKTATNKMRCPIFTLAWTPEGRRLITGASSGEFTLWNGLTFNFETILQAHDSPVRSMVWSHNDQWMVTGDHGGYVKYWQSNMNNVKMFQAHKEPVRCISFSPTDAKFTSCSDDGTVRVWDFLSCKEERVLRGHGSDVKCVDWHPTKGLIASGSKDNQQPVKIWEPKTGAVLCTLHAHKSTVMDLEWNKNGNWLLTASRDHLLKLFDIRNPKEEVQTFRGHKKEASTVAWHPIHEGIFASGGSDGAIMFWNVGADKEVGVIEQAHESIVWALDWHPLGHILCSGSNDHTCKFWTRNRPGDSMRDKYNLNTLPFTQEDESSMANDNASAIIPGMAPEDRIESPAVATSLESAVASTEPIPGLEAEDTSDNRRKTPYAKPIPKQFQASWAGMDPSSADPGSFDSVQVDGYGVSIPPPWATQGPNQQLPHQPINPNSIPLQELQRQATAIVAFGNVYPVLPGSNLSMSIVAGEEAVKNVLRTEFMS